MRKNLNDFYVYEHTKLTDGLIFYVGKGRSYRAYHGFAHRNKHWCNIVKKHGHSVRFVVTCVDEELALLAEIERIDQLKSIGFSLCNMTNGGDGLSGYSPTEETRQKMSQNNAMKNPEIRKKISEKLKNRLISQHQRDQISKTLKASYEQARAMYVPKPEKKKQKFVPPPMIGEKNHSKRPEVREKISKALKGRVFTEEHKKKLSAWERDEEFKRKLSENTSAKRQEVREKMSIAAKNRKIVTCPHCGKTGSTNMTRYHFDNCKDKI